MTDAWADPVHLCPQPFDADYYTGLVARRDQWTPRTTSILDGNRGTICQLNAGELIRFRLLAGAQIVHLFPFNTHDPDERYYAHHTVLIEGLWLARYSRLFGVMARYRPLMTILEDTVTPPRSPSAHVAPGRHHTVFGGAGTPLDWRLGGGRHGVLSTWEQQALLLENLGLSPGLIKDEACLFQKVAIDPYSQQLLPQPSDALPGDVVTLFAELDLTVLVTLSPYVDGGRTAAAVGDEQPRPVEITIYDRIADPLPWPYPGQPYPDISLYLDETGARSDVPAPTPGLE